MQLWDSAAKCGGENVGTFEVGPAVLRSDGTVFYTGSDTCPHGKGKTAIYNSYTGTWTKGPDFPDVDGVTDINVADGPASWEPNDKVLVHGEPRLRQSTFRVFRVGWREYDAGRGASECVD